MQPNRLEAPPFQAIQAFDVPFLKQEKLGNGIELFYYNGGQSEVAKIEFFLLQANQASERLRGQNTLAVKMLQEGTMRMSASVLQEFIAAQGAFLELNPGHDRSSIVLYSLSRKLRDVVPVVREMLESASFNASEFDNVCNITRQNLKVSKEKTSFLASAAFREKIFGANHPYGFTLAPEDIDQITLESVKSFYPTLQKSKLYVFLSGKFSTQDLDAVRFELEKFSAGSEQGPSVSNSFPEPSFSRTVVEKSGNMQCSLRVGRVLFNAAHPDYFPFVMMNEILGGYFGSRLMQNLREDKGLTYGINSNIVSYQKAGYFVIGTDIKKEDAERALDEIRKEIELMQREPVQSSELETVRNYMLGSFANSLTTPFAIADKNKSIVLNQLPLDYFQQYMHAVKTTSPEKIQEMAQRYLSYSSLTEIIGGSL
ncbi:MAG: insulinase family protein [Cytophagaceae bacterium]|jgi:predicted Zn-dependent peptidase|nr:insulinase family protein [Cytophagaceae bacterium]